jgi:hypothetical protein
MQTTRVAFVHFSEVMADTLIPSHTIMLILLQTPQYARTRWLQSNIKRKEDYCK